MSYTWENTRVALYQLEQLLSCDVCEKTVVDPCTLGGCDHIFCRDCTVGHVGNACPVCQLPSHVKDVQSNRQLASIVALCGRLVMLVNNQGDEIDDTTSDVDENESSQVQHPSSAVITSNFNNTGNTSESYVKEAPIKKTRFIRKLENVPLKSLPKKSNKMAKMTTKKTTRKSNRSKHEISNDDIDTSDPTFHFNTDSSQIECSSPPSDEVLGYSTRATTKQMRRKRILRSHNSKWGTSHKGCTVTPNTKKLFIKPCTSCKKRKATRQRKRVSIISPNSTTMDTLKEIIDRNKCRKSQDNIADDEVEYEDEYVMNGGLDEQDEECTEFENQDCEDNDLSHQEHVQHELEKDKTPDEARLDVGNSHKTRHTNDNIAGEDSPEPCNIHRLGDNEDNLTRVSRRSSRTSSLKQPSITTFMTPPTSGRHISKTGKGNGKSAESRYHLSGLLTPPATDCRPTAAMFTQTSRSPLLTPAPSSVKSPHAMSSPALMKKNAKGETPLHRAAIKGDIKRLTELLQSGVDPNAKDNAGWTPLHEACNHGYSTIARILLNYGAHIDTPGMNNETPLSDAIQNYRIDVVRLLVSRGASLYSRNAVGLTPRELARTDEMREALETPVLEDQCIPKVQCPIQRYNKVTLLTTGLRREHMGKVAKLAKMLNGKVVEDFTNEVSHVVCETNKESSCPRTIKYLMAVLTGKWIVNFDWVMSCLDYNLECEAGAFEVTGSSTNIDSQAPSRGRRNVESQLPGLFSGYKFYLSGEFNYPTPSRVDITQLIKCGGGALLTREPKLDNIDKMHVTVPYHADKEGTNCVTYIIHDPLNKRNPIKSPGKSPWLRTASTNWITECIDHFKIVPIQ